jgi:tRNA threonylcarbamoyladenosine biosynthesis protein TsaB
MPVLGFDTATAATVVALLDTERVLELRDDPAPGARPGHASQLLPLIHRLLDAEGIGWAEIDRIVVGIGPGTFTGLRIGLATAHALAASAGKPLVGVSTLAALAAAAHATAPKAATLAVIDARRGEAFAAAWFPGGAPAGAPPALQPSVLTPTRLAAATEGLGRPVLAIGDGAIKFRDLLQDAGAEVPPDDAPLHRVSALWHCRLGMVLETGPPAAVKPLYLRVPDAELNLKA